MEQNKEYEIESDLSTLSYYTTQRNIEDLGSPEEKMKHFPELLRKYHNYMDAKKLFEVSIREECDNYWTNKD